MKGIIRKTILGIWFFGGLSACFILKDLRNAL